MFETVNKMITGVDMTARIGRSMAMGLFIVFGVLACAVFASAGKEGGKIYTFTYSEIRPFRNFTVPAKYRSVWADIIEAKNQGKSQNEIIHMTRQRHGLGEMGLKSALVEMGLPEKLVEYCLDLMLNKAPVMQIVIKGAVTAVKGTPQYDDAVNVTIPAIHREFEAYKDKIRQKIIVYPGGVIGDEPDFVRKMKLGQIQWSGGTSVMGEMVAPELSVFDLPFLFDYEPELYYEGGKYCEIDWIFGKVSPTINELLMKSGFVLFGMLDGGGYESIATKKPLTKEADLHDLTYFSFPQQRIARYINEALGFKKLLVCKIWDLPSITATGMIDSSPCCWYWHVILQATPYHNYVTDYPIRGFLGAVVIGQKDMFDGLQDLADSPIGPMMGFSKADALKLTRGILLAMNKTIKEVQRLNLRKKEGKARRALLDSGAYKLSRLPQEEIEKIKKKILPLYTELAGRDGTYPQWLLNDILNYREEYRRYKAEGKLSDEWYQQGLYPDGYDEWAWIKGYGKGPADGSQE